jgi:hypothetical protein
MSRKRQKKKNAKMAEKRAAVGDSAAKRLVERGGAGAGVHQDQISAYMRHQKHKKHDQKEEGWE